MGITPEAARDAIRTKFFPAGPAKACDCCVSAAALLYCQADSAFMCVACDALAHNNDDKHERFWMCEVCEQAPASVTCKADAASLCVACDRDIHWANPLAGRHDRVPVVPFCGATEFNDLFVPSDSMITNQAHTSTTTNTTTNNNNNTDLKSLELFFEDSDQFLNFNQYQIPAYGDSVVPVRATVKPPPVPSENRFIIDLAGSSCYSAPSLIHSVSSPSMDVGLVPEGSEISYPFARNTSSIADNQISKAVGTDREARVLRYREKRKNRKFEKTIRYASRKAYAERRPRIKGRFVKRTDADSDFGGHRPVVWNWKM